MTDTLTTILQWLIPSGGLGAVIAWLFSKVLRNLRETKEVHSTYKMLYEDISGTLKDLQNEVDELHKELGRFRRAVAKMYDCRYYPDCPVGRELQDNKTGGHGNKIRKPGRQLPVRSPDVDNGWDPTGTGETGDTGTGPA
jgi:hypothetical protein